MPLMKPAMSDVKRTPSSTAPESARSEERRVGKECRSRWSADHQKKKFGGHLAGRAVRNQLSAERRQHGSGFERRLHRFFFQAEDGIRDRDVTGVQTCALPI